MAKANSVHSTPDPILSAIENHQRAFAAYDESARHHADLEELLPPDKRETCITKWDRTVIETDDPRWITSEDDLLITSSVETDAAIELVNVKPQTVAGALALIDYVTARDGWPLIVDDDGKTRSLHFFLLKNVAAVLRRVGVPNLNPSFFVLPTGILKENIAIIDETEGYDVYTMRAPRAARPDDAGLRALSYDGELGEKFAAFLAARIRRMSKPS